MACRSACTQLLLHSDEQRQHVLSYGSCSGCNMMDLGLGWTSSL